MYRAICFTLAFSPFPSPLTAAYTGESPGWTRLGIRLAYATIAFAEHHGCMRVCKHMCAADGPDSYRSYCLMHCRASIENIFTSNEPILIMNLLWMQRAVKQKCCISLTSRKIEVPYVYENIFYAEKLLLYENNFVI